MNAVWDGLLCPVAHVRAYINLTSKLRSSRAFFVTTIPLHGKATRITLRQWFSLVLRGTGVDTSPGSTRATISSTTFVNGVPVNAIMQAADWSSACTFYDNYMRLIPASAMFEGEATSVQNAIS